MTAGRPVRVTRTGAPSSRPSRSATSWEATASPRATACHTAARLGGAGGGEPAERRRVDRGHREVLAVHAHAAGPEGHGGVRRERAELLEDPAGEGVAAGDLHVGGAALLERGDPAPGGRRRRCGDGLGRRRDRHRLRERGHRRGCVPVEGRRVRERHPGRQHAGREHGDGRLRAAQGGEGDGRHRGGLLHERGRVDGDPGQTFPRG